MQRMLIPAAFFLTVAPAALRGQAIPPADPRFKVDILLVVAHPDDESAVSSYLAQAVADGKKRVAIVYGTRGDGGGNEAGPEQAASLGAVREIEGRRAATALGIDLVWFLDGKDTPSQDPLQSLEAWGHGAALERAVRLVRLTRPEVILTWMPQYVIGENHGDHQAAGILATEAFDLAGNPSAFPSQVAPPRNPRGIGNLTEGLEAWQPKKLYFFSDRSDLSVFRGHGPAYPATAVSPARRAPYYQIAAAALAPHLTQGSGARLAAEAVARNDYAAFLKSIEEFGGTTDVVLVRGKSLVGGGETGDVFEGTTGGPIEYRPPPASNGSAPDPISLGGPWAFYRGFWRTHGIEQLGAMVPAELGVNPGARIRLPLVVRNPGVAGALTLRVTPPPGWTVGAGPGPIELGAREAARIMVELTAPAEAGQVAELAVTLESGGRPVGTTRLRVRPIGTMPF